jgi:hypothetical protein
MAKETKVKEAKTKEVKPVKKKETTMLSLVEAEFNKNKDKPAKDIADKYGLKLTTVQWYLTRLRHPKN